MMDDNKRQEALVWAGTMSACQGHLLLKDETVDCHLGGIKEEEVHSLFLQKPHKGWFGAKEAEASFPL